MAKPTKGQELKSIRGTPYRCLSCYGIQIQVGAVPAPGNCDHYECEGNEIEQCGPKQTITIIVYQGK